MEAFGASSSSGQQYDSSDEEINLHVKIIETKSVRVKKSESVRNVKSLIREKESISEDFQELLFSGNVLKDGLRLVDYGVGHNSAVYLFTRKCIRFKVLVKLPSPNERPILMEVVAGDTIRTIKELIQQRIAITPDTFTLFLNGSPLERDEETLASLNITKNSILDLVFRPEQEMSLYIRVPGGHVLKLSTIKAALTIHDVRMIIRSKVHVFESDWSLFYAGQQLEESRSLASYQIGDGSILELMMPSYQIFVRAFSGRNVTISVDPSLTVADVKAKINQKLNIPPRFQSLVFEGKQLQDGRSLRSYSVKRDCTIYMCH